MRVDTQNITNVGASSASEEIQSGATSGRSANTADQSSQDTVALSTASSLVALARQLNSADRQSRIDGLTAQVRSGNYQPSENDVSHALVASLGPESAK